MSALQRVQQAAQASNVHTVEELKRWSVGDQELPKTSDVKHIHVYDFDNTLFASPTPNRQLWSGSTIGFLQGQDVFKDGGWWHDSTLLSSIGEGLEKEEAKAWKGWWNEQIVELVQLTMQQTDAVCVLLTGRSQSGFADLLKRMVQSKGLQFDLICLKPETGPSGQKFSSTMVYKQAFLSDLVRTYRDAHEIRIYEDRPRHVTGFRDFLRSLNKGLLADDILNRRPPIKGEVIEVSEKDTNLDPVTEVAEIQRMINAHNVAFRNGELPNRAKPWQIKRGSPVYTGHLLSGRDTNKLLDLANLPESVREARGTRIMGNNILIAPGAAYPERLQSAGGMGAKIRWRTVALGSVQERDIDVWAMQVEPVGSQSRPMTFNTPPSVVLALGKRAKPADVKLIKTWEPIPREDQHDFETVVGEKVILSIEEEPKPRGSEPQANDERGSKRQYGEINNDQDFPALPPAPQTRQQYGQRPQPQSGSTSFEAFKATASTPQFHGPSRGGRGGGHNSGGRGRRGGGGGRGGGQSYRPAANNASSRGDGSNGGLSY